MISDSEGFLYPRIDKTRCNNCRACERACPILREYKGNKKGRAFSCINKDEHVRMQSSSGGVFTLIAEYVINMGGVVFGAAFDEQWNVCHICVDKIDDLHKLRGSKYLQSTIGQSYTKVKELLNAGRSVLFSGTPCQIGGLKSYLGKEYDNLILQDLICHGVPSPMIWQTYLRFRKAERGKSHPTFRHKVKGWIRYSVSIPVGINMEYRATLDKDPFMRVFLNDLCLRPSCYNCHFKSLERQSDITLADFWEVRRELPEMFDDKGTSLVLVNSEKGERIFEAVSEKMAVKEVKYDKAVKYNPAAFRSAILPEQKRYEFFAKINDENFDKLASKLCKRPLYRIIGEGIIYQLYRPQRYDFMVTFQRQ